MQLPTRRSLDRRLVVGSLVFGIGWSLAGFCPGPAITALLTGQAKVAVFVLFLVLGMAIFERLEGQTGS